MAQSHEGPGGAPEFGCLVLDAAYRHWDAGRAGRRAPARADIDPLAIPPRVLPWLALADVVPGPPRDYRVRLFGSELVSLIDADLTGGRWREVFRGPGGEAVLADFHMVVERCTPHFAERHAGWAGKPHLRYRRVALPLSADGATVDMILTATMVA